MLNVGGNGPDGALTSDELGDVMGVTQGTAIKYLKRMKKSGRLKVAKARREAIDGRMLWTTVYYVDNEIKK